ncbi:MAG: hypothetical protein NDF54_07395 [archaeon GB-1867-035]|nr:hypothetical protein [Candidatus Culexmicrobium profundum]
MVTTKQLLKGSIHSAAGALGGFLGGVAIQAIATAAGVGGLAVPVQYITPVFTIAAAALGFGHGISEDSKK